jgi:hypothetical protein
VFFVPGSSKRRLEKNTTSCAFSAYGGSVNAPSKQTGLRPGSIVDFA